MEANQTLNLAALQGVLANDSVPSGETLTVSSVWGNPANVGQPFTLDSGIVVTLNAAGSITCTPPLNYTGSETFHYTATAGAFSDTTMITLMVVPEINPVAITAIDDQENIEGDAVTLAVLASTTGSGMLKYSATGLPDGLGINSATGVISGTIQPDSASNYGLAAIAVTDGTDTAYASFRWAVESPVSVLSPDELSHIEGEAVSLQILASGGTTSLIYSATNLPDGLTIDEETGLISGTILPGAASIQEDLVTISVTDGIYTGSRNIVWTVHSPVAIWIDDQVRLEGESISLHVYTNFPEGFTCIYTYGASDLPPGLSINSETGQITGVLAQGTATYGTPIVSTITISNGTYTNTRTLCWLIESQVIASDVRAVTDTYFVVAGGELLVNGSSGQWATLLTNDVALNGGSLTLTAVNGDTAAVGESIALDSGAEVQVDAFGQFLYQAATGFVGIDSFTYTVASAQGSAEVTVFVNVGEFDTDELTYPCVFEPAAQAVDVNTDKYRIQLANVPPDGSLQIDDAASGVKGRMRIGVGTDLHRYDPVKKEFELRANKGISIWYEGLNAHKVDFVQFYFDTAFTMVEKTPTQRQITYTVQGVGDVTSSMPGMQRDYLDAGREYTSTKGNYFYLRTKAGGEGGSETVAMFDKIDHGAPLQELATKFPPATNPTITEYVVRSTLVTYMVVDGRAIGAVVWHVEAYRKVDPTQPDKLAIDTTYRSDRPLPKTSLPTAKTVAGLVAVYNAQKKNDAVKFTE